MSETVSLQNGPLFPGSLLHDRYRIAETQWKESFRNAGKYRIYDALDQQTQRPVYVWELIPFECPEGQEVYHKDVFYLRVVQFAEQEARFLLAQTDWECIVRPLDAFFERQIFYRVLEPLFGKTVGELVRDQGKLPETEVMRIMQPVLRTLHAMHQKQILHREIEPSNVFVTDDGRVKLFCGDTTQWFVEEEKRKYAVILSCGFSSPEAYSPEKTQDARLDVYSACAVMYYMLTGITPQESTNRVVSDELKPVSALADVSAKTEKALRRGMELDPDKRIQSVRELLSLLQKRKRFFF